MRQLRRHPLRRDTHPVAAQRPGASTRRSRQSGVTLTSLMVGMTIGLLVLSTTLAVYLMIVKGARDNIRQARLNQELRAALEVMQQDIRRAGHWDFADTNDDGDANGDGLITWSDLGSSEDGAGTFDTNRDGATDDLDLNPLNNPFQRRYGQVNNDLCIGTDAGSGDCTPGTCTARNATEDCLTLVATGTCLTYGYDLDLDGRVGVRACDSEEDETDCPRPGGSPNGAPFDAALDEPYAWRSWYPPDTADKTKGIQMEMFGFRLRNGGIDMRVGRRGNRDNGFGCNAGRWEGITSSDIRVTDLEFRLTTLIRNANPGKSRTDGCETGDICQWARSVDISVTVQIADDPQVRQSLSALVAVRNDRYALTP